MSELSSRPVNILFTGVGRRVELVLSFKRAFEALAVKGKIVGVDASDLAPAKEFVDVFYKVPQTSDPGYKTVLLEILNREKVNMVFPLIDYDVPVLSELKAQVEEEDIWFAVPHYPVVLIGVDKWFAFQEFMKAGIPTPITWQGKPQFRDLKFPLVVKPRSGSAGKDVFVAENELELHVFMSKVGNPIVQEFISGKEITTDVYCDRSGDIVGFVSRERIEIRGGEVSKGKTVYLDEIATLVLDFCNRFRPEGPLNIQCIVDEEGRPWCTEVNFRFGGGSPLGFAAGVRAPEWYIGNFMGDNISPGPLGVYKRDLYMARYDQSVFWG